VHTAESDPDDGHQFELLACAIAGREVKIADLAPGEPAWTDGVRIHLDPSTDAEERLRTVATQASLIAAGSLEPELLRRIGRRNGLARRYLSIEGDRALRVNEVLPPALHPLLRTDPGLVATDAAHSLELARSSADVPDPPSHFGVLRAKKLLAGGIAEAAEPGAPGHRPRHNKPSELHELDAEDEEPSDITDPFSSPVGGGGPIGKLLQKLLGAARQLGSGGSPGADSATHRSSRNSRAGTGVFSTAGALPEDSAQEAAAEGWVYPEWDAKAHRYRPDWCTVTESDPPDGDQDLVVPDRHALRRPLTRLGITRDRCHRQPVGDDIDIDAVVDARVDLAAGSVPDERVYLDNLPRRRDLAVLVLLDVSGSAGEAGTLGQTVHEQQVLTAATLTVALGELGDRVALYGYNSQGRTAVNMIPVKRFDERMDTLSLRRLAALQPGAYSRLGAAIRHGAAIIADRGATSHRLLVVISDGLAYDHGYERGYGAADARRALGEARRQGVGCLCLTVGADTEHEDLQRVFGSAAHSAIAKPAELAGVLGPLFKAALRSAETRRKVS